MPHLDKFSGAWTAKEARHLLKRTTFGVTETMVSESVSLGLSKTISKLFEVKELPSPPLKFEPDTGVKDPGAKFGETWVNAAPYPEAESGGERNSIINSRKRSLYAWTYLQMQNSGFSITEKLTLFWHNHFVSVDYWPHREYVYINKLRANALGNFKEITKLITVDPSMLVYLSGTENTNVAPNENYARELLELFTIGKGDAVGNGDYTHYTEGDIAQIARVLTGWRARWIKHEDALNSYFTQWKHTSNNKILSHRFNNSIILENGEDEYKDLIDTIFEQDECSRYIMRQLYIWFVNAEITPDIEKNIIEPLARITRVSNYEIAPALKVLFASDHFFENVLCMIKSPLDLFLSMTKSLNITALSSFFKQEYDFAHVMYLAASDLGQFIFNHPDVAGWKAYYQKPLYYKTWVNNFFLPKRLDYCRILVTGGDLVINKRKYRVPPMVPVLEVAKEITNATDPNVLIQELATRLFNYEITQEQINSLKAVLIDGLPDFEWTVEYSDYLSDPSNSSLALSVDKKLRNLIATMVQMSEFQIM